MRKILFILTILCYSKQLWAQRENNVWVFGHSAALDFNSGTAVPIQKQIGSNEGCASVSDNLGRLLFYSIGTTVWNRNGQVMPNGTALVSYQTIGATQSTVIAPVINSGTQYYVFSLEEMESIAMGVANACRLSYSVVDMSLNNGLGDVVAGQKGSALDALLSEHMVAIPGNSCDIWLVVHGRGVNQFKSYHITQSGISSTPVISTVGNLTGTLAYLSGVIKASPDRSKIVLCSAGDQTTGISGTTGAELYNFDPGTGLVSNAMTLDTTNMCYGAAFSADNSKLYISGDKYNVHGQFLSQYDLSQTTVAGIIASRTFIYDNVYSGTLKITDMRLGLDGKIYMNSASNLDYMDCLEQPDVSGTGSNYMSNAIHLVGGTTGDKGMTNIFAQPVISEFTSSKHTICLSAGATTKLRIPTGYYFRIWNDTTGDTVKTVSKPGIYWVRSQTYCKAHTDSFVVTQEGAPFSLGADTTICSVPLVLHAPQQAGAQYMWQNGDTTTTYSVQQTGTYTLTVNTNGCSSSDTIKVGYIDLQKQLHDTMVCREQPVHVVLSVQLPQEAVITWSNGTPGPEIIVNDTGIYIVHMIEGPCTLWDTAHITSEFCDCIIAFPGAFTPNADGRNDVFRAIYIPACPVKDFKMNIYNRWGQKVFTTTNISKGWDGMANGMHASMDTYMYEATYTAGNRNEEHKLSGDLTLIR